MPNNIIKSFAKKSNKSVKEVEKLWDKSKGIAEEDGHKEEYDYIVGILKRMLNLNETLSFSEFVLEQLQIQEITTSSSIPSSPQSLFIRDDKDNNIIDDYTEKFLVLEYLNSNIMDEGITDYFAKQGLKLIQGKGLVNYMAQFMTNTGKLILASLKGDTKKMKEILKKVNQSDVLDFLLKLDAVTLGLVSSKIMLIDNITGWGLMDKLKNAVKSAEQKLKDFYKAVGDVKKSIGDVLDGSRQRDMLRIVDKIEKNIPNI